MREQVRESFDAQNSPKNKVLAKSGKGRRVFLTG
jgi:hypothetical protein|tara:strand:+ start:12337 stop:12438 length:102 start_codon:yes stop_codon:yes gene_type:complete